jgi:cobalt-zinc-cadmium resistance protein CzcA
MLEKLIELSLKYRFLVLILGLLLVVSGVFAARELSLDAFPDTTPVQVKINTTAPSLGPEEVEQQITLPVELSISGLPGLKTVRSISKFGLSQVTVIFEDEIDIYLARQVVQERLQTVELPEGISSRPQLGPVATGLGEVFHYLVERPTPEGMTPEENLTQLRALQDWNIKLQLRSVPGVAEVNTWGGFKKQYHVRVRPNRLAKYDLTIADVERALRENNANVGGGYLDRAGENHILKGVGLVTTVPQIENIALTSHHGVPIRIRDVAEVRIGHEIRRAATTADGEGEKILGLGFMLMGENSREVTAALEKKLAEVQKTLPAGVTVTPLYTRTHLVDQVLETVRRNLMEGALLVVAVLFVFLGNLRAGLIVASAIPLSMLFAGSLMLQTGVAGSLMSLGAIDFGLVVDSSVVMVENCARRLSEDRSNRSKLSIILDAAVEVRKPTMFGELIIMIVYLPILTLEGMEGKLFRPMALTVIFALLGSLVMSLTLIPVLASFGLPRRMRAQETFVDRRVHRLFHPVLSLGIRFPWTTLALTLSLTIATTILGFNLGSEFIPQLKEGAVVVNTVRLSGVSLKESVRYGTQIEKTLLEEFPDEIENIWTRTGTPEVATDPMGLELSDVFITLAPRDQWKRAETQSELVAQIAAVTQDLPGMRALMTQPIEMRVNEMIAGIRGDVGVKIFGDDLEQLKAKAAEVERVLKTIPGAADVYVEQVTGQPVLRATVNNAAVARYGVSRRDVLDAIEAVGGIPAGEIRDGHRRFDLVIRLHDQFREDPDALSKIILATAAGQRVPVTKLIDFERTTGPAAISREWGRRRILVQANVRGRDVGSFVEEAQAKINPLIAYPFSIGWGGQFEHMQRAQRRLSIIVPITLILIFSLLYVSFHSIRDALMIFCGVFFARIGGVLGLWLRGMPFSISAGVGFVVLAGCSMLDGLVLVSTIRRYMADGMSKREAIEQARLIRLRPVLMTGLVACLGFVPMALSTGVGAEVQRPLATVVVFGVATDTFLTMLVLPAMYLLFGKGPDRRDEDAENSVPSSSEKLNAVEAYPH